MSSNPVVVTMAIPSGPDANACHLGTPGHFPLRPHFLECCMNRVPLLSQLAHSTPQITSASTMPSAHTRRNASELPNSLTRSLPLLLDCNQLFHKNSALFILSQEPYYRLKYEDQEGLVLRF